MFEDIKRQMGEMREERFHKVMAEGSVKAIECVNDYVSKCDLNLNPGNEHSAACMFILIDTLAAASAAMIDPKVKDEYIQTFMEIFSIKLDKYSKAADRLLRDKDDR